MATASEKAQFLYWYAESGKSAVTVQRYYRLSLPENTTQCQFH